MKYGVLIPVVMCVLAGCQQAQDVPPAPAALSQSDAEIIANRVEVEMASADAARIKAIYAPDVVAFDPGVPGLIVDRATFDKAQDAFAALKFDSFERKDRKVQVLSADIFIVSGTTEVGSTTIAGNKGTYRYTDVYKKEPDGKWLIVNEHTSLTK
ncbi:MAG: DUF4440 domain-containing protein [Sphingobium sp.]